LTIRACCGYTDADAAGSSAEVSPLSVVIGPTDTRVVEDVDEAVKLECVVNARYADRRCSLFYLFMGVYIYSWRHGTVHDGDGMQSCWFTSVYINYTIPNSQLSFVPSYRCTRCARRFDNVNVPEIVVVIINRLGIRTPDNSRHSAIALILLVLNNFI